MDKQEVRQRWSRPAFSAAVLSVLDEIVKDNVTLSATADRVATAVLFAIEPFIREGHRNFPSYFSVEIEQNTHSATLEASLEALKLELRDDVHREHARRVRGEISRLTGALEKIAKGYPCGSMEDMRRVAKDAIGMKQKPDNSNLLELAAVRYRDKIFLPNHLKNISVMAWYGEGEYKIKIWYDPDLEHLVANYPKTFEDFDVVFERRPKFVAL